MPGNEADDAPRTVTAATARLLEDVLRPFVEDVRRTLDPSFSVAFILGEDGSLLWSAYNSSSSVPWSDQDDEAAWRTEELVLLAEAIPDFAFDDVLRPWPPCPDHRGDDAHPLHSVVRGGRAMWVCRQDGNLRYAIGHLPATV